MTKARTLLLALLALPFAASAAPPRSNLDVRPLIRWRSEFTQFFPETGNRIHSEVYDFISRGGYVFRSNYSTDTELGEGAVVGRGFAESELQEFLRQALTMGRVGLQSNCYLLSGDVTGFTEITWNGRGGRVKTFRATFRMEPDATSRPCTDEMRGLLGDIEFYVLTVVGEDEEFRSQDIP